MTETKQDVGKVFIAAKKETSITADVAVEELETLEALC
jgi:hypothetical protein